MRVWWRILAIAFALCGAGNAVAQFTGDSVVSLTLDSISQRVSVVFPTPAIDAGITRAGGGEYYWRCQQTDANTGRVIRENFAGINVGHPNSRFLTFLQISSFVDISNCDHITADLRVFSTGNTLTISGTSVRITGVRREGNPPYVTINIGHTGSGYTEGDVYSFTVIFTDLFGVKRTVRNDESLFIHTFTGGSWSKAGRIGTESPEIDGNFFPNPLYPGEPQPPNDFASWNIKCKFGIACPALSIPPTYPYTYTLSHSDLEESFAPRNGYTVYLDHFRVLINERGGTNSYFGYLRRNSPPVFRPFSSGYHIIHWNHGPVEGPQSFATHSTGQNGFSPSTRLLERDRNGSGDGIDGLPPGVKSINLIWQYRLNGGEWSDIENPFNPDEGIQGDTVFRPQPSHFPDAEAGDHIEIRNIADIRDEWGLRNFVLTPTLSHTDRPPTGNLLFLHEVIQTELKAGATLAILNSNINDPDGEPRVLSYQWQAGDGTVFADIEGATLASFELSASIFNQNGNSGTRVLVEMTDPFFGLATVTSDFLLVNPPTEGEITIDGNPVFADGEIYTAITAGLSDGNDIGYFTYQWFSSIDGGNNYNEIAGETGESYTFESGDFAGADENTPAWLRVSVVHTDADGFRFTLSASLEQDLPTQGEIVIDGNPLFADGEVYIAETDSLTDGNGIGDFTDFQWAISFDGGVNYEDLPATTGVPQVYRLNTRDLANLNPNTPARLRVSALHTDAGGYTQTVSGILIPNIPTQGEITIDGNPMFAAGEVYTAITAELSDENDIGGFTYQWLVSFDDGNNYVEIAGEIGESYTLESGDFAGADENTPAWLRVSVVHTDADGYRFTLSASLVQDTPTQGEITIDGSSLFADGEIYTAITAALSDSNEIGGFTYQWLVSFDDGNNYNEIAGETGETYTADTADFAGANPNTPIFLGVSAVHTDLDGYAQTITAFLEQDLPTQGDIVLNVIADPLGLGEVKFSVNVDALTDGNDIGDFAYQWFASIARDADYNPISAATDRSYILDRSDFAGAAANEPVRISVSVVHTDLAGYEQSFGDFFVQNPRTEGEITIDGNPMFADGEIYTAITAALSDRNGIGDFTYQWVISFDGGNNYNTNGILGIDSTYTLRAEDIANADENIPALLGVAAVHTDLDGNTQTLTASFLQNIAGTGGVSISGTNSFAAGEKYTAITNIADANMIGTVSYSWQASTDGGTNYNLITDANSESYTLALSDFAGATSANPVHLLLSVVHTDMGGFSEFYLATLIHSDTAAGGSLGIEIQNGVIAEDAIVELDTAAISDINGGGIVSHSWHLDNGAAIAGADAATYTLQAANLTLSEIRNGVLHSEVLYRDDFGGETRFSITLFGEGDDEEYDPNNPNELDSLGTGTVAISGTISFAAGEKYTADISDIAPNDANGEGDFAYSWHTSTDGGTNYTQITGANSESYTLALSDFAGATSGAAVHLRVSVVHTDFGGFDQSYLATLIHSDTAAGGSLGIEIQNGVIAENAVVELDTAAISDINGGGIVSHSWHLDNGAAIVGETSATYILSSANLTLSEIRNGVLHSEVLYRDDFGYETRFSITLFGEGDDEEYDPDNPNELDSLGTGTVAISGTISFAANEKYTADISDIAPNDANGKGTFTYSWHTSTDGGNNYTQITGATLELYTLALSDFAGANANAEVHLRVSVVHTDFGGFDQSYLATLIHSDTAAGGSLGIEIQNGVIAENAVVELDTAAISDINGGGIVSHSWHLDNGAAIVGETSATYTLQAANLTLSEIRNGVLHSEVLYRDSFGYETRFSITLFGEGDDEEYDPDNPNELDSLGTGTVAISGTISFAANERYTADISDIAPNDANGEGDFAYSWHTSTDGGTNYDLISGATLELYTLALSDFAGANANAEVHLRVSVVHTDFGGFDQSYLATLIHSDTAAGGSLGIEIQSGVIAEDAIVELNTAGISDINGGGIVSHSWHLDNGAAIVGETSATYVLSSANLTLSEIRNGVLHSEVLYRDSFGYETRFSITLFGEGDDEEYDPNNPNELDSLGTGTVAISGTISFAANEKYTADISDIAPNDANGEGDFAYSWHTSTDGGNNYTQITGATLELYTLALSDFAGANANAEVHLRVSVVHTDFGGFDQSYLATLIHSDTAAGGSLGIGIRDGIIAEDAIVELDTAAISDINGGGIVSHSWHLDNGAAIAGADAATYTLSSANLTLSEIRNGVLHSEVLYRDSFGYETRFSITLFGEGDDEVANLDPNRPGTTTNPVDPGDNPGGEDPDNPGNIFGTGSVSISGANSFAAGEKYTAITNIADANRIGTVSYSWQASTDGGTNYNLITDANSESYTLSLSDFAGATSANPVHLLLSVVHTDMGGFSEFYLATLIHSDTAAGGSLGIGIQSGVIAEDAIVELNTAGISDINGGGIISHSWHLDNGAAIVGATAATYILSSANLTLSEIRNGVLHSEVLYRDSFGYETRFSITLFGEGDDEVANPDPNRPGTPTNPVDPSDNPGGEDPDNPGNIFGTGSVSISGANSFAAGEKYTAITNIADANVIGTVSYSWQASTDGGTNYTQITDANSESYTLALSDFSGATSANPVHLLLSVVHTDMGGFSEFYLATLIHSDTAAGGSLGIEIQNGVIAENAVVELDTAAISDINGGGIVSHSWHLDNGAAIVGADAATYILSSANLTLSEIRNGVLHSEVLYRDDFGYETRFSITLFGEGDDEVANPDPNRPGTTTNPVDPGDNPGGNDPDNPGNIFGTGSVSISGANSFAAGEKYTAITNIADANVIGTVSYSWQASTDGGTNYNLITDANSESYTLALSDFAGATSANPVHLLLSVVHTDMGGFSEFYLATLIHSDTAAGGSLEIVAAGLMAGDLVTADAAGLADANGALTISYRWQTGERNTPESFADLVGETEAVYTIYADDYDSDSRDSLRLIARTADPFGGETEITSAILPINRETEGRISLELVGGEIVAGATIRLRTDAVSDENGGGFEKYYWFINDLLLMEENDDFLVVRSDDLRDIAAGGLRAEAKYVDGIGFTVRLSARLIAAGIVAPSPEEIANWSVVIETEGVAFGEDLARANLIGAEQSDYYEVFYRWRTGVGIAFADERNVGGVGNYHQLEAANFNPQDHLRAIAEVELLSGTFVTLTSAPVQIDYPSIGAVRIVAGELLAPGVVVSADISDVRDANGGVNVVSERWLYADTPVAMARSYTLTEEAVHAGKVFYEATFADAAGFRTSLRAEANVGGEVSSEKAEAIIGAVNAAAIDGLWNALEGHLDSEAGWRANGAPIEDPSQIAAALSRRDENSLHPDSPFALDSFALKESGGEAGEEWSWWAHGSRSRLKGKPIIDGEEVKYHGDYASFHAGMDRQISDTVRAGLAFSADDADLDVEWRKGVDGQLRQNIRSLIPYTEWRPDDLTNVRILAGYGEGDIYLAEHDNASRASARRTLFGIRAARRKDLADNFDITFSGGFDKTRLQTDAIDLPGLQDDLDARTKETHARVRGGHISLLPAKGSLHKEISLRWRSQSVAGDRDSVFDLGIGFNATLPEYFLSFGADGERQLTDSAHERNRFGVYIAYGAGRFAHILETRYDNEIALPQNRWQINTVSEWGVSELLTGVYVEHNGNADLRIGWESNLLF